MEMSFIIAYVCRAYIRYAIPLNYQYMISSTTSTSGVYTFLVCTGGGIGIRKYMQIGQKRSIDMQHTLETAFTDSFCMSLGHFLYGRTSLGLGNGLFNIECVGGCLELGG